MDIDRTTVKEILAKRLGEEKAARILEEINKAYQEGKRGEELREHLVKSIRAEGLDAEEINLTVSHAIPTS
jgi:hypothetical protein